MTGDQRGARAPRRVDEWRAGIREILFVELLGGFGDLLLALPAIHRLVDSHPGAAARVVTFSPGGQLLAHDPRVREVVELADHTARAVQAALAAAVLRWRPDLVVTTSRHSGIPALLTDVMRRAGGTGPRRDGLPALVSDLWRQPSATEPVGQRYTRLLAADGWIDSRPHQAGAPACGQVMLDEEEREAGSRLLRRFTGGRAHPVLLVPETGMAVKRWPAGRWSRLAGELARRGHPVLSAPTAVAFERGAPVQVLPATSLRLFASVAAALGRAGGVVVGGDTGPVRLAVAVGVPAVGLFGPTLASRYGFAPNAPSRNAVDLQGLQGCPIRLPLSITEQECWWTARCPLSTTGPACMADLAVPTVLDAVARVTTSEIDFVDPAGTPSADRTGPARADSLAAPAEGEQAPAAPPP